MTWVAIAVGGAAVLGAGASYAGAKKQSGAAKDAANLQMQQFQTINQQQQPFIQGGYGAMSRLNTLLGLNPRPNTPALSAPASTGIDTSGLSGMAKLFAEMRNNQLAQQGGQLPGNAYMPTPGGGVQPNMTNDRMMYTGNPTTGADQGNPFGIPSNAPNIRLQRILALRAANGDTEAARILRQV